MKSQSEHAQKKNKKENPMDRCYESHMDSKCPKCEDIQNLCLDLQLEQADADVLKAMNRVEEIKKKISEQKNIADVKTMKEMSKTHEPLCPECGRRAFPTNFEPLVFGGREYDKRTVWFCSDMGHCKFSVDEKTLWQPKKKKEQVQKGTRTCEAMTSTGVQDLFRKQM